MSLSDSYNVAEWCRAMLATQTGLTNFAFRHKDAATDADDNCIMVTAEIGKRAIKYEKAGTTTAWHGKLTVELRSRVDMTIADSEDGWADVEDALRAPGTAFATGLILHDEECEEDKRETAEQFRHITRIIPFVVEI